MRKSKIYNTLVFGLFTIVAYAAIFLNSETIMKYFTKGGSYGIFPVATAFLVSFIHGAFAGNFWSAVGIEASKKITIQPRKRIYSRPRPRLYLQA